MIGKIGVIINNPSEIEIIIFSIIIGIWVLSAIAYIVFFFSEYINYPKTKKELVLGFVVPYYWWIVGFKKGVISSVKHYKELK